MKLSDFENDGGLNVFRIDGVYHRKASEIFFVRRDEKVNLMNDDGRGDFRVVNLHAAHRMIGNEFSPFEKGLQIVGQKPKMFLNYRGLSLGLPDGKIQTAASRSGSSADIPEFG